MPPDIRALSALDHAAFDAALVEKYAAGSKWVHSTLSTPFSGEQLLEFTRQRLLQVLTEEGGGEMKKLIGQPDKNVVLTYLANELLAQSGKLIHVRQRSVVDMVTIMRRNLLACVSDGYLQVTNPASLLWPLGKDQTFIVEDALGFSVEKKSRVIEVTNAPTKKFMAAMTGQLFGGGKDWSSERFEAVAKIPMPFEKFLDHPSLEWFSSLDRTHVEVYGEAFRRDIHAILQGKFRGITQADRQKILQTVLEHWGGAFPDFVGDLQWIETELRKTPQHKEIVIFDEEPSNISQIDKILDACFHDLSSLEGEPSPELRQKLLNNLIVLEYLIIVSSENCDGENIMKLQAVLVELQKKLQITWKKRPDVGFATMAIACRAENVTWGQLMLHL